ncbi:helix-turn-helix transcriptional regulator [Anaerosalibacter massiliensis]|uniref:Transcriptional regulator n=1 Tax=Anaerosalibacter massiliensis TaxID=1347392 RepID=A0A9X2S6M3_9FIRM|nr:transcriptional regulator [Anaerosalibacter massiliensis]MCR2045524.1 transcriptional regulator [Anaerosalibacter massiliensis]
MYKNLEAEMVRRGITRKDLAKSLDVRYATIIDKLKGRYSFTLDEAFKIKNKYFPTLSFEYLFETQRKSA